MAHKTYKFSKTTPINPNDVRIIDGFWKDIIDRSRKRGLKRLLDEYENRQVVKNFIDVAEGNPRVKDLREFTQNRLKWIPEKDKTPSNDNRQNGMNFDEFLFKALEACGYYLSDDNLKELHKQYYRIRDIVISAQQPDGYLNTIAIQEKKEKYSHDIQELYACGHLVQAGIAALRSRGDTTLFDVSKKYMDCIIDGYNQNNNSNPFLFFLDGRLLWPDHPNIEMALVELYRETGEKKYLDFCKKILDQSNYTERSQMFAHAVCEILHATGGTDYYMETGDLDIWGATKSLWDDALKKVYITGAIGSVNTPSTFESVGKKYELTNVFTYGETCASISYVFWSWRMFLATTDGHYTDMMERVLYNGVLGGVSLDGCKYFYQNPLEYRSESPKGSASVEESFYDHRNLNQRKAYHYCSCCPPNVQRLFASLHQYIYTANEDTIWINLFVESKLEYKLQDGTNIELSQETNYPWEGISKITLNPENSSNFTIMVRIPEWCDHSKIIINDEPMLPQEKNNGYLKIKRNWDSGDHITIDMSMKVQLIKSHPKNIANYGKLVLSYGPVIYCIEQVDNPDFDIFSLVIDTKNPWKTKFEKNLLEGVVSITGKAFIRDDSDWERNPYQTYGKVQEQKLSSVIIKAIPYFAWANRGKYSMITAFPYIN